MEKSKGARFSPSEVSRPYMANRLLYRPRDVLHIKDPQVLAYYSRLLKRIDAKPAIPLELTSSIQEAVENSLPLSKRVEPDNAKAAARFLRDLPYAAIESLPFFPPSTFYGLTKDTVFFDEYAPREVVEHELAHAAFAAKYGSFCFVA